MLWTDGSVSFLLAKTALAYLPTALSVASRPPFSCQQTQHAQVFLLKPALFFKLIAGLGSTNKSAIFLLLLPDSRSVLSSIFPFTLIPGRNCFLFPPVLSGYNGSPDTPFSRPTTRLMSWPDGERNLFPQQSLVVSRIHCSLFSDWRHTVSPKFFDTQVASISTEELVLRHARCILSRLRCNGHSLLLSSYLSRIGGIENPSCGHLSQYISHLILHCTAMDSLRRLLFGNFLSLYDLWSRLWRAARFVGPHGLPPPTHPSKGVW